MQWASAMAERHNIFGPIHFINEPAARYVNTQISKWTLYYGFPKSQLNLRLKTFLHS